MFSDWLTNKEYPYLLDNDFEDMYHYKMLIDLVEWCEHSNFEVINDEDTNEDGHDESNRVELFNFLHRKMNDLIDMNVTNITIYLVYKRMIIYI